MPTHTEDEIKTKIANKSIFAISVDTAIFDRYGCNLKFASLRKLDQFKDTHIRVLLSEIVEEEVTSHIARDATETQRMLKKALSVHAKRWQLTAEQSAAPATFNIAAVPKDEAKRQFSEFADAVGAEIVSATDSPDVAAEVMKRYFRAEAPFEANEKKKHEFPDAFALLSLEQVAAEEKCLILCVSADKGWQAFADKSDHLICVDEIDKALSFFNEADAAFAKQIIDLLRAGNAASLQNSIESAIQSRLDDNDFEIEALSGVDFEAEQLNAAIHQLRLDSISGPIVIAEDADTITFTIKASATVGFEAIFSFYVKDWIDRDHVHLDTEDMSVEHDIEFDLAVTIDRDVDPEPEASAVEVASQNFEVNFGNIEPFSHENPEHEKY